MDFETAQLVAAEYEYTVEGVTHRASRFTYRPRLRGRGDTDFLAERYSEGTPFSAWVDPADPARAVVDPRPSYGLPAAGLVIHGALLALVVRARRAG